VPKHQLTCCHCVVESRPHNTNSMRLPHASIWWYLFCPVHYYHRNCVTAMTCYRNDFCTAMACAVLPQWRVTTMTCYRNDVLPQWRVLCYRNDVLPQWRVTAMACAVLPQWRVTATVLTHDVSPQWCVTTMTCYRFMTLRPEHVTSAAFSCIHWAYPKFQASLCSVFCAAFLMPA